MTQDIEVTIYPDPWTPRQFLLLNKSAEAGPTESWIATVKLLTQRTNLTQDQILDMPIYNIRPIWRAIIDQLNSSPDGTGLSTEPLVTLEQAIAEVERLFRDNKKGGSVYGSNSSINKSSSSTNGNDDNRDSSSRDDATADIGEGQDST